MPLPLTAFRLPRARPCATSASIMHPAIFLALVHYPVMDKHGLVVSTSITNLDIHDISRASQTYGVRRYYLVTPVEAQHWLARRVVQHWEAGWGATYNPNRKAALGIIDVKTDLAEVGEDIKSIAGAEPLWVVTSARSYPNSISFADLRSRFQTEPDQPYCLVLGTGHGLHAEVLADADLVLEPIHGPTAYNHLSVRSAASIMLDRLLAP